MDGCRNSRQYVRGSEIVKALQKSGCYVGCLEELAWKEGFVSLDKVHEIGESLKMTNYGQYLLKIKSKKVAILHGR